MDNMMKVQVMPIAISIIEVGMCYQFLYCTVLEKGYRNGQRILIWVNILLLGSLLGINRSYVFFSNIMLGICIVVTTIFAEYILRKELLLTVSLIGVFYTVVGLIDFLIAFVSMNIFQDSFARAVYLYADFQWKSTIYFVSRAIVEVIIWIFSRKKENITIILLEYKRIIVFSNIIVWFLLICYQKLLDDMAFGFKDMHGTKGAFSLACVLILMGIVGSMIYKYQMINKENDIIILKDRMLEYNFQKLQEAFDDKRILLHDMKNHLLIVENYMKNAEYVQAEIYLAELAGELDNKEIREWTGNRILDFIINYKKKEAEEIGIRMHIECNSLPPLPFSDNELCALFFNLLDNAIEACRKIKEGKKDIYLILRYQKQMFFVESKNTFCEHPHRKHGRLITTKKNKDMHGYGIKSMERIVSRYDGRMTYYIKDEVFTVKISFFDLQHT